MSKSKYINLIEKEKIMVVIRGIYDSELLKLTRALVEGGIKFLELTYDPLAPNTYEIIEKNFQLLQEEFGNEVVLGVGTVLKVEQVRHAKKIGAKFAVSPSLNKEIVQETNALGLVSIPGVITPTEIVKADEYGADFLKMFPAGTMGLKYCKDLLAPLPHLKYIATVAITEETFEEYLKLGFSGAGIGSKLVDKQLMAANDYKTLTERAKKFVEIANRY